MKYKLICAIISVILWMGCYEETNLTPTQGGEVKYTLPQGDHDYDEKIVGWYERCGFYILYKYEPKDIYWNLSKWQEAISDSITKYEFGTFKAELPDENFVGKQLEFLERAFLNFYPEAFLKRFAPMKFLLAKELQYANYNKLVNMDVSIGFDYMILSHGDETIDALTARKKELIKDSINIIFLQRLQDKKTFSIPQEFANVSASYYGQTVKSKDIYATGFLTTDDWTKRVLEQDWKDYIRAIVKTPFTLLNEIPEDDDFTNKGILNPKKDTQGKIIQKYNIVINYFKKEHGIDLQKIGDYKEMEIE